MHDQFRSKNELVAEVTALRKQVADLKEAAAVRRRVEDALRTSEAIYRELFEHVPWPMLRLGPRGEVLAASEALASLLGYAGRRELGELASVLGLFASVDEEKRVMLAVESGAARLEAVMRRKDGSALPLVLVVARLHSPAGCAVYVDREPSDTDGLRTARR